MELLGKRKQGLCQMQDARQPRPFLQVKPGRVFQITLWRLFPPWVHKVALLNIKNLSLKITWKNIAKAHTKFKARLHNYKVVLLSHILGRVFGIISVENPVFRTWLTQHPAPSYLGRIAHTFGIRQETWAWS